MMRQGCGAEGERTMHEPKWCLFFDFHTMPANPDVGKGFDFEAIADWLAECGVDFIVFPARCNLGVAYYDTRIGLRHPALTYDLLGRLVAACHRRNIAVSAYVNVGLSHEEAHRHREWCVLREDGHTEGPDRLNSFFRQMCYNTAYGPHVTAMAEEVVRACDVDGLLLDCMHTFPCLGVECLEKMEAQGVDWHDPRQLHAFNYRKIVRMGERIAAAAKAVKPELLLYCNGVDYEAQAEFGTYLEFECLPQGGWGYELLPVCSRYLRTLGKPVLNMTGRFQKSWGDFGGIRTTPSVEYDCLYGIANGLRTTIGDHFHPRGDLNRAVMDLDREIYRRLQELEPWIVGARPLTDLANLMLKPYPGYAYRAPEDTAAYGREFTSIKAATRMLCELKMQFDNVSHAAAWDYYQVLILPDSVTVDAKTEVRLRAHLSAGGAILSTGWSGLDPEQEHFVLDEWGVAFRGDDPFDPAYIEFTKAFSKGMPDMPVTLYERGTVIEAAPGTEVLARITAPYYSRHWDGAHGFVYLPPDRPTERPAVTLNGRVAHVSHPIFRTYFTGGAVQMRQIVANLLERLLPEPLIRAPGAPSYARLTVTMQPGRRMVHVLSYLPEARGGGVNMIEEPLEMTDVVLHLRLDGEPPGRVYLAPAGEEVPFSVEAGYVRVVLPHVRGYAMVVFEQ